MNYYYLSAAVLIALALFYWYARRFKGEEAYEPTSCATCSGESASCYATCAMETATKPTEYFDDEELDRFAGRKADQYSEEESEEFRYVLNTMQPAEVAARCRSLTARGLEIPLQVREEVLMLMQE